MALQNQIAWTIDAVIAASLCLTNLHFLPNLSPSLSMPQPCPRGLLRRNTSDWMPLHKFPQWLTCSLLLLEPLQSAGVDVKGLLCATDLRR